MSEGAGLAVLGVKPGQLVGKKLLDVYGAHPTIAGYIRRGFAGESFWYTVEVGKAVYNSWLAPCVVLRARWSGWPGCRTISASFTTCSGRRCRTIG